MIVVSAFDSQRLADDVQRRHERRDAATAEVSRGRPNTRTARSRVPRQRHEGRSSPWGASGLPSSDGSRGSPRHRHPSRVQKSPEPHRAQQLDASSTILPLRFPADKHPFLLGTSTPRRFRLRAEKGGWSSVAARLLHRGAASGAGRRRRGVVRLGEREIRTRPGPRAESEPSRNRGNSRPQRPRRSARASRPMRRGRPHPKAAIRMRDSRGSRPRPPDPRRV